MFFVILYHSCEGISLRYYVQMLSYPFVTLIIVSTQLHRPYVNHNICICYFQSITQIILLFNAKN